MSTETKLDYKVGDKSAAGHTIAFIYGQTPEVIVFQDEKDRVQWEVARDVLTPADVRVQSTYDHLNGRIRTAINIPRRPVLVDELAQALFLALTEPDPDKKIHHFTDIATRILQEAAVRARVYYVSFGTLAAILVGVALALSHYLDLPPSWSAVLLGAAAGAVGAWTSVLQRAGKLEVGWFDPPHYLAFQGVTRIALGTIFGGFAVIASRAGVALSMLVDSGSGIAIVGFLAGFSERYVPEMLKELETQRPGGAQGEAPAKDYSSQSR